MRLSDACLIQLDDLDYRWGEIYDLAVTRVGWVAKRLDNGRALVAPSPGDLRAKILANCMENEGSREVHNDEAGR